MAEKPESKNIYQRMIEVQKKVLSVQKNETVKMSETDKGYKAVTHDDVAAALHLALAEAGIVMLPDVEKFTLSHFDKTNQWGKVVTWYRTDIEILVKWINADKPDDFIQSKGAAFALDTSDKSFAKAYSLALKIVLLKVHLLESRDGEEQRPFDDANGGTTAGKGQPQQNPNPKPAKPKQSPDQVIMPFGQAKGKKIGDMDTPTLEKAAEWLRSELKRDPKPQNHGQLGFIYSQVKAVLTTRQPEPPPPPPEDHSPMPQDAFPPDEIQQHQPIENQSQEPPKRGGKAKANGPSDFMINFGEHKGKTLMQISESEMKKLYLWTEEQMKVTPPVQGIGEIVAASGQIKAFLKEVGVWPINHAPK